MRESLTALIASVALISSSVLSSAQPRYNISDLGTLGGQFSAAVDINSSGQVVGSSTTASGQCVERAYLLAPIPEPIVSALVGVAAIVWLSWLLVLRAGLGQMVRRKDRTIVRHVVLGALALASAWVTMAAPVGPMRESWSTVMGGPDLDDVKALAVDPTGAAFVVADSLSSASGYDPTSWFIAKLSPSGNRLWSTKFTGENAKSISAYALSLDVSGNPVVASMVTRGTNTSLVTVKFTADGMPKWTNTFGGMGATNVYAVRLKTSQTTTLLAVQPSIADGFSDILLLQLDELGSVLRTLPFPGTAKQSLTDMQLDQRGNVFLSARDFSYPGPTQGATVKFNAAGIVEWSVPVFGVLAVDLAGQLFVAGGLYLDIGFGTTKFDQSGKNLWSRRYRGPAGLDWVEDVAVDAAGNVILSGTSAGYADWEGYGDDFLTVKYSPDGERLWVARFDVWGGRDDEQGLALDLDGNTYVFGYPYTLAKFDSNGLRVWTTSTDNQPAMATSGNDLFVADSRGQTYYGDIRVRKFVPESIEGYPQFQLVPQDQRQSYLSNVVFKAITSGKPPMTNRWQFSSAPYGLIYHPVTLTNDTLILPAHPMTVGEYWVEVSNSLGRVASPVARLEIEPRMRVNTYWDRPRLDVFGNFSHQYRLEGSVDARSWSVVQAFVPHQGTWSIPFDSLGLTNSISQIFRAVELAE